MKSVENINFLSRMRFVGQNVTPFLIQLVASNFQAIVLKNKYFSLDVERTTAKQRY